MTVEQCGMFLESQLKVHEERFKEQAVLFDGLSIQIVSGISSLLDKKGKRATLQKLYPELFNQRNSDASCSESQQWLKFLFG